MSEPVTARDHALRVTGLEAVAGFFADEYDKARAEAEPVFRAKYTQDGNDRQMVMLPDGEKVSQITIKAAAPVVTMQPGQPGKWAAEHNPGAFEEYIAPHAVDSREVVELVKLFYPELVKTRIRPATAKAMRDEIVKYDGWLMDEDGEKEKVADVTMGTVTGAFAFTGNDKAKRRDRIMAELLAGRLLDVIGFAPLALPGGDDE
jgi:hypothetical protein